MSICKYGVFFVEFGTYWPARFLRLLTVFSTVHSPSTCTVLCLHLFSIISLYVLICSNIPTFYKFAFLYVIISHLYLVIFTPAFHSLLYCQLCDLET